MKFMIASDIHGSAVFCEAMLERFSAEGADRLLLLGDLLYHGPRNDLPEGYAPKKVITMLNRLSARIICVRGNCEAEVDQMVLEFPVLAEYAVLPLEEKLIYMTHGHHAPPPLCAGDILLCGHTHVPKREIRDNYTYLNPGSIAIPKENSPRSYMTLEAGTFTWKNLGDGKAYMEYTPVA